MLLLKSEFFWLTPVGASTHLSRFLVQIEVIGLSVSRRSVPV